jgi:hypothetical protein
VIGGFSVFDFIGPLFVLAYIGVFVYTLMLLTRITRAVERIADKFDR